MSASGYFQYWMRTNVQCGAGSSVRIPALFESMGARRVLLLSDEGLRRAGLVDRLVRIFGGNESGNLPSLAGVYDQIAPDAGSDTINSALKYAREVAADSILALGGGSVLDAAKAVKYALYHNLTDITEVLAAGIRLETSPPAVHMGIPHIAVPTTAGTGAEVTNGAVILNEVTGIKCGLVVPFIEADLALLDAQLTVELPRSITGDTGMDALTHAVEVVAMPETNHFTDAHAFTAISVIDSALPRVVQDGQDLDARNDMLQASTMACNALVNNLGPLPVHNFAHAFGALFHIPHGRANGVLLPIVMETLRHFYRPSARRLALGFGCSDKSMDDDGLLDRVIARIRKLQELIGMPTDFSEYGVTNDDLEAIIEAVANDPVSMFYKMSLEEITIITRKVIGAK